MSDSSPRKPQSSERPAGILAGLSNRRPQRPSARRASTAARPSAAASPAAKRLKKAATRPTKATQPATTPKSAGKRAKPATTSKPRQRTRAPRNPIKPPAPRQGFESGSEIELGRSVGPPSSIELAGSVVGLLGDAAQAGLTSGGRLFKGALSRLPGL